MTLIPHICGKNRIQMPNSGCDDCAIYSIDDELLESLTPLECYEPSTCEDLGTPTWSCTSTASWQS